VLPGPRRLLASLVFISIDYDRYVASSLVSFLIGLGGLRYAQAVARRQDVRPIRRVTSWPGTAAASALFGGIMFVLVRAMDPGSSWQSRAVTSTVVAVAWGVTTRMILKGRHDRMARATTESPAGR
jgi:hypothetical protein